MTLNKTTLRIVCHYAKSRYAECSVSFIVMQRVEVLNVVMLSTVILNVVMSNAVAP